jgi:subfamily B ATP-binding cassette protein MsbA
MTEDISLREKLRALYRAALFRPLFVVGVVALSLFAAVLEAIGLSFLLPIVKLALDENAAESSDGALEVFVTAYDVLGLQLTLESVIVSVTAVLTVRYTASFLARWMEVMLRMEYLRYLQTEAFENALDARISYFDAQGSDEILNAIVTQARQAISVINQSVQLVQQGSLALAYLAITLYISPLLTVATGVLLGGITYLVRYVVEPGYAIGDRVATANEHVQESVQAGMQGIRDVKLFGVAEDLREEFADAVGRSVSSKIVLSRNKLAMDNGYQLITAITIFLLIYVALRFTSLSLAGLGLFLFAMFRLAPRVSSLNTLVYKLEGSLPHLVRTQEFIDEIKSYQEPQLGTRPVPRRVDEVTADDVSFSYETGEQIFEGLSVQFETGEFIAFVGPSGTGKSTIISLLTRMYEPDEGEIRADGTPITEFDLREWRSRISVVRQNPFIFNDTLRQNVTIGNQGASESEIRHACETAQVTEFLDDLPEGYDTVLGDEGVRLSGGQKQRVALARALLKDAEFLVLDEATSDLDSNIEETVQAAIESMDRGMLVIAHRFSTVVNADRIYTIEDGRISETGTHSELVEHEGTYAELYATQTHGG